MDDASLIDLIRNDVEQALKPAVRDAVSAGELREMEEYIEEEPVCYFLASHPQTPSRILEQVGNQVHEERVGEALASNRRCPSECLAILSTSSSTRIRATVASNVSVSPQVAQILADDVHPMVRSVLARNSSVPPRLRRKLRQDPSPWVRSALLRFAQLESDIFAMLLDDRDPLVRVNAIRSKHLTEKLQLRIADSDDVLGQGVLLALPSLCDAAHVSLCFSQTPEIQLAAIRSRELPLDEIVGWSRQGSEAVREGIAAECQLPQQVETLLTTDRSAKVRCALAHNPGISQATVDALAVDAEVSVLLAVAGRDSLAESTIGILSQCEDLRIHKALATRDDLTTGQVCTLLATSDDVVAYHLGCSGYSPHDLPGEFALPLVEHRLPTCRLLGASSRHLSPNALECLVRDPAPVVRVAVTQNGALSDSLLRELCADPDGDVSAAAQTAAEKRVRSFGHTTDIRSASVSGESQVSGLVGRLFGGGVSRDTQNH